MQMLPSQEQTPTEIKSQNLCVVQGQPVGSDDLTQPCTSSIAVESTAPRAARSKTVAKTQVLGTANYSQGSAGSAAGSAAANRELKHSCLRGRTESKRQLAIPTPDRKLPVRHAETRPSGSTLAGCPSSWLLLMQLVGMCRCIHGGDRGHCTFTL